MARVYVSADRDSVLAALRDGLSPTDFKSIETAAVSEDVQAGFATEPSRAEPITTATVVIWVVSGIVGGAAYDLTKKVAQLLVARFGEKAVTEDSE